MASRIYEPPKCEYTVEDGCIRTDGSVKKKITGTAMGGIMGVSPWSTPFQVACNLLGVAVEDISSKPAVMTGKALESRIIDYIAKTYPEYGLFVPAESVFEKREGDHDSWESDFKDEVFAGHVDGMLMGDDGSEHILEIKTSGNLKSWEDGVPVYYQLQVGLYNHFIAGQDKAYVVLGVMTPEVYRNPDAWHPDEGNTFMFEMPIDTDYIEKSIEYARSWYEKFIDNGITPPYDPNNPGDVELYNHLLGLTDTGSDVSGLIDEFFELDQEIKQHGNEMKEKEKVRDGLKTRIKDWFDCHDVESLDSRSGLCYASISVRETRTIDPDLLREDGLDPDKYTVVTTTKTFSVKRRK